MKLNDLIHGLDIVAMRADLGSEVTLVTADSRQVVPGALFVAIPGFVVDGSTFIGQALDKGAAAVVTEKNVEREGAPYIQVDDARAALARLAAAFYGHPASKLRLIGVTGTSGKTTTTLMIESILDATGEPAGLIGTIEYRAGSVREIADRTTPDAVVLQRWFAKMVEENVRYAVMEVSSHALSLQRTAGVPFAAAVFTNLSRDHFDFHRDFEDYFAAKRKLFDQIDLSKRSAVVNADDAYGRRLIEELGDDSVITFGTDPAAAIRPAEGFSITIDGLRGTVETPIGPIRLESPLLGAPNLSNWMAAIGAAIAVGIEREPIERGIRNLPSVRGRFERVGAAGGRAILVDYAHKPDALEKLLHAVRELAPDRKVVVVFGCGGDRDAGKRPLMGEIAARLADETILTSDNPRSEDPMAILREIEDGYEKGGRRDVRIMPDRREAIRTAVAEADPSRVVVIAGKGHETYQVVGDEIVHFDDREEVETALEALEKSAS